MNNASICNDYELSENFFLHTNEVLFVLKV